MDTRYLLLLCSVCNGVVDQTATAGSDLQLECGAASLTGRAVVWRRAGRVLAVGKLLVRADGKGGVHSWGSVSNWTAVRVLSPGVLELLDLQPEDQGEYECVVDQEGRPAREMHRVELVLPLPSCPETVHVRHKGPAVGD